VNGPWTLLVLDPEPGDPKWIVATVVEMADVRPAAAADTAPDEVTARWVAGRRRVPVALAQLPGARVWRVDQGG